MSRVRLLCGQEESGRFVRRSDAELPLCAVDVVFHGPRRDAKDEANVREGFTMPRQGEALPLATGQMNVRDDVQRLQLFADLPVELVGDDIERKSVRLGRVQKCCPRLIGGEGQGCEPAVSMMDGDGVAIADAEVGRLIEESVCEGGISEVSPLPKGRGWRMLCSTMGLQIS